MHSPTDPIVQPEWVAGARPPVAEENRWLYQAQRFSLVRLHVSVFAIGSVVLLALNLLARSATIWADTWIAAWGVLVLIHAVVASIATLVIQLLAEDADVRPATEVQWSPAATWIAPEPARPAPPDDPWKDVTAPDDAEEPEDRVSWKTAADAAWMTRAEPDAPSQDDETSPSPSPPA
jgi:hypothetical protein